MSETTLLPAIRSNVGDWSFYVTTLTFDNVEKLIKSPDEIHERKKLSDWIQREAIDAHADKIAKYIADTPQRFLGALIIGVYDGNPNWTPLNVKYIDDGLDIREDQKDAIQGKLGLLHLSGNEKLFAIDGQHRVAGIKRAFSNGDLDSSVLGDEVSAIFVAHDESSIEGKQRTRRLFTTVNKKAKRISKAATIALDEDNGFAIVTRNLIDRHWLFEDSRKHISYTSTGAISAKDESLISSVVGLYEIVRDLFHERGRKNFEEERPTDQLLEEHLALCTKYFDILTVKCHEYRSVFVERTLKANKYRDVDNNNLLFRPIGQRAFARATEILLQRKFNLTDAIVMLLKANLNINSSDWHNILWDPINNTMITKKLSVAETQLLILSGNKAKNSKNMAKLLELKSTTAA